MFARFVIMVGIKRVSRYPGRFESYPGWWVRFRRDGPRSDLGAGEIRMSLGNSNVIHLWDPSERDAGYTCVNAEVFIDREIARKESLITCRYRIFRKIVKFFTSCIIFELFYVTSYGTHTVYYYVLITIETRGKRRKRIIKLMTSVEYILIIKCWSRKSHMRARDYDRLLRSSENQTTR